MSAVAPSSFKMPPGTTPPGRACEIDAYATRCDHCCRPMQLGEKPGRCPARHRKRNLRSIGLMIGSIQP